MKSTNKDALEEKPPKTGFGRKGFSFATTSVVPFDHWEEGNCTMLEPPKRSKKVIEHLQYDNQ
jgi:hypothetical protein